MKNLFVIAFVLLTSSQVFANRAPKVETNVSALKSPRVRNVGSFIEGSYRYAWVKPALKLWATCALVKERTVLKLVPHENCYGSGEYLAWYKAPMKLEYVCALVVDFDDDFFRLSNALTRSA